MFQQQHFLLSPVLVLLGDCVQVLQRLLLLPLRVGARLALSQRVDHGHVHVEVVRLLKAFLANEAREFQVCFRLVLRHVVF